MQSSKSIGLSGDCQPDRFRRTFTAANVGLVVAMTLLAIHGWLAGRAAQLQGWKLVIATSIAAGLGLVMILLKDLVLIHLH